MTKHEIPWVIEEHTLIKHELLKKYVDPWIAIFFNVQKNRDIPQKVIYFDGFCGPGTYYTDETKSEKCPGSPLLVAKVANKYLESDSSRAVIMHCMDKDPRCVEMLKEGLTELNHYQQEWSVYNAEFNNKIHEILDKINIGSLKNQPMFFFLDPYGYSGYPMSTLARILEYPRAELFINFMVYDIIRFCEENQFEKHMRALFNCDDFKKVHECRSSYEKPSFLVNLYTKQLTSIGAKYVMPFRVNTPNMGDRPRYYLIHVSKNIRALKVMKDNMAKISDAPYRFEAIGLITDQMNLFENPDKITLRDRINNHCNKIYPEYLYYEELEDWAYINTIGVSKTIKEALIDLEKQKNVIIERKPGQRNNTVTNGAKIHSKRR